MFFPSPRNSISAQIQLLEQVGCTTILVPSPRPPPVTALLQHFSMNVVEVPLLEMLLSASYAPFPFKDNFQDGSKDEILVLHSSGTTGSMHRHIMEYTDMAPGIPKPLSYSYDFITYSAMISRLQPPDGFTSFNAYLHGKRIILLLPSFHVRLKLSTSMLGQEIYSKSTTCITRSPVSTLASSMQSTIARQLFSRYRT